MSAGIYCLLRTMLPALLLFGLSGCWLWIGDPMSGKELQAFAPGRSSADVTQSVSRMLTSLGAEPVGSDASSYLLGREQIVVTTEARPRGTWLCVHWLGKMGTTAVDPAVAELYSDLRPQMEKELGADFVTPTSCSASEPYWPDGDGS